nr:chymotrypsin-like protease [Simulium damnosum=blackflies, infected with Onchocerca ochengi, Peptide Partial, 102 aa] [Simulium damnosum]
WVVTAAHCLCGQRPENLQVLVGTNDLKKGGTRYDRLFDDPQPLRQTELPQRHRPATGWERLSAGGPIPNLLQTIDLNYVSYEECKRLHNGDASVYIGYVCTF